MQDISIITFLTRYRYLLLYVISTSKKKDGKHGFLLYYYKYYKVPTYSRQQRVHYSGIQSTISILYKIIQK